MPTVPSAPFSTALAAISLGAGVLLGLAYFGGLWWTLGRLPERRRPHAWVALSFALRALVVLAGFGLMVRLGGWWPPLFGLGGFQAARVALVRRWGIPPVAEPAERREEG